MEEIIFIIHDSPKGGFEAEAIGHPIFCEANTIYDLKVVLVDAVKSHFDKDNLPKVIRLHITKVESITLYNTENFHR